MQPLNPFLRAFFRSPVPAQAVPLHSHVVLVPTTESLVNGRDKESGQKYTDVIQDEEFLGSHVLRIPAKAGETGKDANNIRDTRGKAKSFTTVNGRTVIIKESMVYSNKGFRSLTQAQIQGDVLYHHGADSQQWLMYYISRPLIGIYEAINVWPAIIGKPYEAPKEEPTGSITAGPPKKRDVKTFSDLLNEFPMIARQMQPGLERLFNEFGKELGKPLPPPPSMPSRTPSMDSIRSGSTKVAGANSLIHKEANGDVHIPLSLTETSEDEEDHMRRALETAVTAAIDLFQLVDKQQLSFLGATTDLTGPLVERLIERYVAEQVHDTLMFSRLCSIHRFEDSQLDHRIRQMENIDVAQVGIAIEDGKKGKDDLIRRLNKGVEAFRKMGVASSPHEMLEILLKTNQAVTEAATPEPQTSEKDVTSEKQAPHLTINADVLVSLLLIVVIRSQIRHLQARLTYMQRFIFIDDVESGEMGYALSTFEAVLSYLTKDAGGLRRASFRNKRLWDATKTGNVSEISNILEANGAILDADDVEEDPQELNEMSSSAELRNGHATPSSVRHRSLSYSSQATTPTTSNLSHVFPFEREIDLAPAPPTAKSGKKVSMDMRSLSSSSAFSFKSRTTTNGSITSGIEGDTSVKSLSQTQDPTGNSVVMMAVEARQPESLQYFLTLPEFYPKETVLEDVTSEGTTLLSAAIQLAHTELIDIILDYVYTAVEQQGIESYLTRADSRGRTAAHYLFNAPQLMSKLGNMLPWRKRDRIGQTPLFALCRSYDHPDYGNMVSEALNVAKAAQRDGSALRLDEHTDNKGNTLLHIVNDPAISLRILRECDADPNAINDKQFTPLMLASKYGRVDMVRVFFTDPRVDLHLKELRGLTAVELAKDDEVRNRIDDMTLLSNPGSAIAKIDGRITTIVRSYFVEDGSIRLILKSGAPSASSDIPSTTFTITTSRRTLADFANLTKWLSQEHPASYIPVMSATGFRSPFQIHSRPSRAVLHSVQTSLDRLLKILLTHPTFANHPALWEFFLVPDMQSDQIATRSAMQAQLLAETIAESYTPVSDLRDVEQMTATYREMTRGIAIGTRSVIRRGYGLQHAASDFSEAFALCSTALLTLGPPTTHLPKRHVDAFARFAALMATAPESSPLLAFVSAMIGLQSTIHAVSAALGRSATLIARIREKERNVERDRATLVNGSLPRRFNLNLPGLEESRTRNMRELEGRIEKGESEVMGLEKELSYTREVVVGELAGWTSWREGVGREAVRGFVRGVVVRERERLRGMKRVVRALRGGTSSG